MGKRLQVYEAAAITVTFDPGLCIHARECVRGLPGVFNPAQARWIRPERAAADRVAEVVARCPTGALRVRRPGQAEADVTPAAVITVAVNGPLLVRGRVRVQGAGGEVVTEADAVALCRCGGTANPPFCDGSHERGVSAMLGAFLAEQVRLAHEGPAWHGPALARNLDGVSAVDAAAHPIPGGHSIWEIVLHVTAWAGEARRRLAGGEPAEPVEGDWPEVGTVSEPAWHQVRQALRAAHEALAEAVRNFPASRWSERIGEEPNPPLGSGVTYAEMIGGLLQHDGYHSGQIGLLRRALNPGAAPVS